MNYFNGLISPRERWGVLLWKIGMMGMFLLARVNSEADQMGAPAAGLLCISDCTTCPVICSPPPPPGEPHYYAPPSHHSPPPQPYNYHPPSPSPPPPSASPPPPPPAAPSPRSTSRPPPSPSWYPSWGPPSVQVPPKQGQYPYPYYYFYASKASSLSFHASFYFSLVLFHVSCCVLLICC
ncbi:hypothetical protein P3X46_007435 [Hevea brasiliensis]|uniref:Uncharacterized protein n=1 Tax=Hevea brasiliensis TaxID=3981 RepID=A0ABQ9MWN6_HEVBR|nr:leucine-rich repeat extensin-like protein 3 [Hevea brasiliensis]KAJ9183606.1 hypothetical protein P3X46_007435 [Hevea brasiliensis]